MLKYITMEVEAIKKLMEEIVEKNKMNYEKIKISISKDKIEDLDIKEHYKGCPLQHKIDELSKVHPAFGKKFEELHRDWHEHFRLLKITKDEAHLSKLYKCTLEFNSLATIFAIRLK